MSTNWKDGFIDSDGTKIHYYRTGGSKPSVVLNHGATDDGLCWTRIVKDLEDQYDLIMLDTRGHGLSYSGNGDYSSKTRAGDITAAIRELDLDRPVVGGHSLGADASLHLAANYPNLTRGIFLEDPPIVLPGQPLFGGKAVEGKGPVKMMRIFMTTIRKMPSFLAKFVARKMMPDYPDDEIIPWVNSKKRVNQDFFKSMETALDFSNGVPEDLLSLIEVPVLLFIGTRENGSIVSFEAAERMKNATKSLQIVHLEGASHDIRRTRYQGYLSALQNFLAGIFG